MISNNGFARTFKATLRAGALGAMVLGSAAYAQDQQSGSPSTNDQVDTIIVTAQRRSESAQTVPIAISAFSADTLSNRGIATPLQLVAFVPNLFGANNTGLGSANAYYIRGLGNTETIATFDPPVGTYIDDIYMSRQNGNNFAFFDIDRIEVLRGPQGTLFGRNTTGGAINVIMKQPGDEIGGFAEAAYGAYDLKMIRGSIDLPLSPGIAIKVSGYYQDTDGYVNNTTTGERANDSDMAGLRGAIKMKITDDLVWNGSATYMRNSGENLANFTCDPANPANCNGRFITTGMRQNPAPGTTPFAGTIDLISAISPPFVPIAVDATGDKLNYPLGNEVETQIYISNFEWQAADDFTFNVITGYIDMSQKFALDFADGRGLPNIANPIPPVAGFARGGFSILNDGVHKQFTQEVKLNGKLFDGAVEFVTGVFYINEKNATDFADLFGNSFLLADRRLDNKTEAWAGYVQADLALSDQFKATAGIRYTDEEKTFRISDNRFFCNGPTAPARCLSNENLIVNLATGPLQIPTTQRAKLWTPRFALNWTPNDETLLFASATRGFKSGGWNARGTANNTLLPFDPETVWSYEIGAKTQFLDNRLRVNVTGFFLDTSDLQTPTAFVDPQTGAISFITQNFADYENKGVELEITAVPTRGLNLYMNVGYQDDKYKIREGLEPNRFGVQSVRAQQADCLAQLAAGQVPLAPSGANNAAACAAGVITADGGIATPVRTPDWTLAFGGSYDIALPSAGIIITPSVNAQFMSALETGTANGTIFTGSTTAGSGTVFPANPFSGEFITGSQTASFWQVSAALQMRTDDDNWLVSLECQNCFDKAYAQSSLANVTYISPPRTWQLRLRRNF
ncbi:MAG: TonB-dependent receptor [Polymorphobacter sp.]|uniref:TonB-dependent receptor n=1 Tax=Polymorphobacter sp. TaxID=1909290 RepID=UPI003A8C07CD